MLALLAIALLAQTPQHRLFLQPNLPRQGGGLAPPAFAFATGSGVGMGSACACTAVTGTKGEAVTFTRASSGTCLKGSTTTGVANGDMVTCSNNQPRVGTGGSGSLKLLVEESRTNLCLRSQELENAAWSDFVAGVAAPTITANAATAPDNTATAERFQIPATLAAQASGRFNAVSVGGPGVAVCSLWVKGNGTSGTIDLVRYNNGAGTHDDATCAYDSAGWNYCATTLVNGASSTFACYFGNLTGLATAATVRPSADVFIWGLQAEQNSFSTSYIATAGTSVTRAVDSATVAATAVVYNAQGSAAATVIAEEVAGGSTGVILSFGTNNRFPYLISGSTRIFDAINVVQTTPGANWQSPHQLWASWAGASMTATNSTDALTASGTFDGTMQEGSTTLSFGSNSAAYFNGWIGDVCLDPVPTRCR